MTITSANVEALQAEIAGKVHLPGDPGYAEAVSIWNGAISRQPGAVAGCTSASDVSAAMRLAAAAGIEVSVRGGGHNYAGSALTDGGLMIDLTPMKAITVDAAARRARCGGGTTWGELDAATQEHALAVPGGFISHTGVAGLTLGGGLGWLSRLAGLSCDNLVGAEVVTPDGEIRRAAEDGDADLLWAIRGGGGNFGVVTEFEFALVSVGPMVHLGLFMVEPSEGEALFRFAREYVPTLPDECGVFLAGLSAPPAPFVPEDQHFTPKFAMAIVGLRDEAAHAELVAPVRAAINASVELVTPIPYVALQQMFDESAPWGFYAYEKAIYLDDMNDGAIAAIIEHQAKKMSPLSFVPIFAMGGCYARVPDDATAFGGRRNVGYVVNLSAMTPTEDGFAAERDWVRNYWSALEPFAAGRGSYVNFISDADDDRISDSYGEKYARLRALKGRYDPDNVLHLNANIQPS